MLFSFERIAVFQQNCNAKYNEKIIILAFLKGDIFI